MPGQPNGFGVDGRGDISVLVSPPCPTACWYDVLVLDVQRNWVWALAR